MKDFWAKQAERYGFGVKATNFDPLAEDLECYYLEQLIRKRKLICDIGCGNGRTLLQAASKFYDTKFYGVDFTKEMIDIAKSKKRAMRLSNIDFFVADIISPGVKKIFTFKPDTVITKRLLINLKGPEKLEAIKNIHSILKKDGTYIMVECFIEPLKRINKIRNALNLEKIKVKDFNEYLDLDFFKKISMLFEIKKKIDFGSLYYFTSRVYNAYLSNGNPNYYAAINKLALKLTKINFNIIDGYSPEIIYILRKK